jgi:hypothetical protein
MLNSIVTLLIATSIKGAAVFGLAALIAAVLRNASAARRHLVWSAAVTAVLLIPLLAFVVPAWGVLPTVEQRAEPPAGRSMTAAPSVASWEDAPAAVARDVDQTVAQTWTPAPGRGARRAGVAGVAGGGGARAASGNCRVRARSLAGPPCTAVAVRARS